MHRLTSGSVVLVLLMLTGCASDQAITGQMFAEEAPKGAVSQQVDPALAPLKDPVAKTELSEMLVGQLGVDSTQAMGGVGAILALARQRLSPLDFMRLSDNFPEMDQYLSAVPQSGASISWFSSPESLMGESNHGLGGLAVLANSFRKLGMDADMIGQFVPIVLQYVQAQSGPEALSLLQGALYR